jgi:glycosyltransferase involved in cell wall biosynthesis
MNILFVHEVDWLAKLVFDIHFLAESLSLLGHKVYAIDYENQWRRDGFFDFGSLKTKETEGVSRAFNGSSVSLRRPGFIKIPGIGRISAALTHHIQISRTIQEKSIDAVVLYSAPTNGLQAIHAARKSNIPVVFRSVDILNQLVPNPALRPVTRFLERKVYKGVDMLLTLTPGLSRYAVNMGADESKVKLLLMPVDTNMFYPSQDLAGIRQEWQLDKKDRVIVYIGTLFEFSGLEILIQQFPDILKAIPEAKLMIVGDGPQRSKLDRMISGLGLEKQVIITGFQPYTTMPRYINLADLCVNPFLITSATRDIFPGKIVQYLACGKPVVATPLPGTKAVIPGEKQGVIYTDGTDDMGEKIIALLKEDEYRERVGKQGLTYAKRKHSYDIIAHELEQHLKQLSGSK